MCAAFDTRNAANFVGTYAIPFGHGRDFGSNVNRFVDWAIGGWKVSVDAVMYSGFPITIGSANVGTVTNNGGGARANQYQPLRVKNRSLLHWFGTDPSATPCTLRADNGPSCAYGAELASTPLEQRTSAPSGRRDIRVVDISAFKQFRTYKEQVIQFRVDAFNVGNIASYAAPAATASTTSTLARSHATLSPASSAPVCR